MRRAIRGVGRRIAAGWLALAPCAALADDLPAFAPYRPLYPASYLEVGVTHDDGDEAFDAGGHRGASALPVLGGDSRLPETRATARFTWTFPLFEADGVPFFSDRLHTARVTVRAADLRARGAIDDVEGVGAPEGGDGSGLGDTTLEFGSFLAGSGRWREGKVERVSVLLLFGLTVPTGVYEHEAVANAGTNHPAGHVALGLHARAWTGGFADVGVRYTGHGTDEEPAYGGLVPSRQGGTVSWDARLAQRLRPGLYLALGVEGFDTSRNRYANVTFVPNAPEPPLLSDVTAVDATFRDGGTSWLAGTLALRWFVLPRLAATVEYRHPFAGESGEPVIDLVFRTPAGCDPSALTCAVTDAGQARADGLGGARSLASDRIGLSLTWQFGQGDTFTCPGCES
ncbi:MAG TPA: transporter [Nevskiaceae bacterium]|nr:transporter [Nevskiaceae bacterium]